ncbi:hypothetical protein LJR098_004574 [Rhizobium sp. LjRoot98]|uniref:hypothetical protein n=1 Tax=unclassified Rhizobium TaxID=2613769 RepID=UPI001FCCD04A|nr:MULTISPECIES: hypothetical protein [unclassified Rhizobium]
MSSTARLSEWGVAQLRRYVSYLNAVTASLSYVLVSGLALEWCRRFADRDLSVTLTEIPVSIKRVLVLEDNFIIAMDAEDVLKSIGIEHVDIAGNVAEAQALIEEKSFDFALLDVNLGTQTSFDFATILIERAIDFGFVSGYGDDFVFPPELRDISRITKPFNESSVAGLLGAGLANRR